MLVDLNVDFEKKERESRRVAHLIYHHVERQRSIVRTMERDNADKRNNKKVAPACTQRGRNKGAASQEASDASAQLIRIDTIQVKSQTGVSC